MNTPNTEIVEHVDLIATIDTPPNNGTAEHVLGIANPDTPQIENWEQRYKELQSAYTKKSQQLVQLKEQVDAQTASHAQPDQNVPAPPPTPLIGAGANLTSQKGRDFRTLRESSAMAKEYFSRR